MSTSTTNACSPVTAQSTHKSIEYIVVAPAEIAAMTSAERLMYFMEVDQFELGFSHGMEVARQKAVTEITLLEYERRLSAATSPYTRGFFGGAYSEIQRMVLKDARDVLIVLPSTVTAPFEQTSLPCDELDIRAYQLGAEIGRQIVDNIGFFLNRILVEIGPLRYELNDQNFLMELQRHLTELIKRHPPENMWQVRGLWDEVRYELRDKYGVPIKYGTTPEELAQIPPQLRALDITGLSLSEIAETAERAETKGINVHLHSCGGPACIEQGEIVYINGRFGIKLKDGMIYELDMPVDAMISAIADKTVHVLRDIREVEVQLIINQERLDTTVLALAVSQLLWGRRW